MTTPPVAATRIRLLFQSIKFSWNPNPKPFNKFDIETQAFFEDTVFPYKRTSQSSLDCSKPSTTTTTPKSDSSSNHPELHQLLHRSPHDNRSLCDDRLHHQLHLLNPTVNDITLSTSPSSLITTSKVTIQNNIFYPLDLEEHLLQFQHGDPWSTWRPSSPTRRLPITIKIFL